MTLVSKYILSIQESTFPLLTPTNRYLTSKHYAPIFTSSVRKPAQDRSSRDLHLQET